MKINANDYSVIKLPKHPNSVLAILVKSESSKQFNAYVINESTISSQAGDDIDLDSIMCSKKSKNTNDFQFTSHSESSESLVLIVSNTSDSEVEVQADISLIPMHESAMSRPVSAFGPL